MMSIKSSAREFKQKLYTGRVTFDNVVSMQQFMRNVFQIKKFDNRFSLLMKVPGKKMLQYIFTIFETEREAQLLIKSRGAPAPLVFWFED